MTSLDTHDELALPAFEDALWAALRADHVRSGAEAGTPFPSASTADDVGGTLAAVVPLAGPRRRRIPHRTLVAAAIVLVVGLGIVVATGPGEPVTTAGPSSEAGVDAPLTIEERAAAAIHAQAGTTVLREDMVGSSVPMVQWGDGRIGTVRRVWTAVDGQVLAEQGSTRAPVEGADHPMATVDHCGRAVYDVPAGSGPAANPLEELALGLGTGVWAADGAEVVDGRRLLRFRAWPLGIPGGVDGAGGSEPPTPGEWDPTRALYLDPETLLPVLERTGIGADDELRTTYTLLPRTEANLARTVVTVPEDYERRSGSPAAEPSPDGC